METKRQAARMPCAAAVVSDGPVGVGEAKILGTQSTINVTTTTTATTTTTTNGHHHSRPSSVVGTCYTFINADLPPLDTLAVVTLREADEGGVRGEGLGRRRRWQSLKVAVPSTRSLVLARSSPTLSHEGRQSVQLESSTPLEGKQPLKSSVSSSGVSSSSSCSTLDEDDVTCAICLDLLRRPRCLPCRHTFCLLCLQDYVNSCRDTFTCPTCRRCIQLPKDGVMGLATHPLMRETARILRRRRQLDDGQTCNACQSNVDVATCGHCERVWCGVCGIRHAGALRVELTALKERLAVARDDLHCHAEEDETRLSKLEESIVEVVEERVAALQATMAHLSHQVSRMRRLRLAHLDTLSYDIEAALQDLASHDITSHDEQWEDVGYLHANLTRLLNSTTAARGPRVTLDETSLTLTSPSTPFHPTSITLPPEHLKQTHEDEDEDEDEKETQPRDPSIVYRSKGSYSRLRWGQHLGERPAGVAVCPTTCEIYVTGSDICRVFQFDLTGKQVTSFGSRGHGDGQFLCPVGIAFGLINGEIYVTDKWKHCIHVFDASGRFLRQLGRKGKGYGHFSCPEGIATDRRGRIYVADTCNHRIQVLDSDGVFLREVGVVSSETLRDGQRYTKTEFNEPTGVAASPDGSKIYVADAGNHRVKVFDGLTGQRLLAFGSRGRNKGQFESPECIAVDDNGYILVGDSGNGRVQVFRGNGNFIRYFGCRSSGPSEFNWVSGVALSKSLDVVVTDFKNNTVALF